MSWTVNEDTFDTKEDAYKEYSKSGFEIVIDRVLPNISDARTIARENRGRGRILVPYKSSAIDDGSKKAEKLLADIRKVQDDAFQKIFPIFEKFKISKVKCGHCESTLNMAFKSYGTFSPRLFLEPNNRAAGMHNIETDSYIDEWCLLDDWRILRWFSCLLCNKSENKTAEKVAKIVEKANEKLNVLHEKLFAEVAGSERVRYLACKMVHS